jgi:M6 family metalloprotease-like protein
MLVRESRKLSSTFREVAMPLPLFGKPHHFTQPDGSTIEVLIWGNVHHGHLQSLDGYTLVEDPHTGFLCYAETSPAGQLESSGIAAGKPRPATLRSGPGARAARAFTQAKAVAMQSLLGVERRCEQRRKQAKAILRASPQARSILAAPPPRATAGDIRGLCLLVDFADEPAKIARKDVVTFCNEGSIFNNHGSVYDYFFDNSKGRLRYTNQVTEYYRASRPRSYYTDPKIAYGNRARELITEALQSLVGNHAIDASQLSVDGESCVYAVNVFYAGTCPNNWSKGLWPHSSALGKRIDLGGGKLACDYQITDIGTELDLGTFCHENGHMVCDFDDYYDYGDESLGLGNFCLMSSGGSNPKNPSRISAYLRYKAGWIDQVVDCARPGTCELPADGSRILIFRRNATEYFLVENRHQSGRDADLPGSGMAVWHVDELGSNNNEQMTESMHYECSLEQADGNFDLEKYRNEGGADDLFLNGGHNTFADSTTPPARWWDGTPSGLIVEAMGAAGPTITVRSGAKSDTLELSSSPNAPIPDAAEEGIRDVIQYTATPEMQVASVKVGVSIQHSYRGDLRVSLVAPDGTEVVLHDRAGGGKADLEETYDSGRLPALGSLVGKKAAGPWTLWVRDLADQDVGLLKRWTLSVVTQSKRSVTVTASPGKKIPDATKAGLSDKLTLDIPGKVADLKVGVNISHSYIGDLEMTLVSPSGSNVTLHKRAGGSTANLVRTYDAETCPALAVLRGEVAAGSWTLKVADLAKQDVGKLNSWSITCTAT